MERNETELLEDNYDLRPISKAGQHMKQAHPWENVETRQKIDARMGFTPFEQGSSGRLGWLVNMQEVFDFKSLIID